MRVPFRASEGGGVRSLERAIRILNLFSEEHSSWTVSEIAGALSLPLASTHRLVKTLERGGLLQRVQPRGALRLGTSLLALANVVQAGLNLREVARPHMQRLAIATGDTTVLLIPGDGRALCVEHVDGTYPIRPYSLLVGESRPYNAGAAALVLLAFFPIDRQREIIGSGMTRITPRTPSSAKELESRLQAIVREGVAYSESEVIEGTAAVAAPVFHADGSVVASLGVTGIEQRFAPERRGEINERVKETAAAISRGLGFRTDLEAQAAGGKEAGRE